MKRFINTIIIFFMFALAFTVLACSDNTSQQPEQFLVTYSADNNGYIQGNETQSVTYGKNTSAVTAKPFAGYRFVKWLDNDSTNPERADFGVIKEISAMAQFEKIILSVRYKAGTTGYWDYVGGYIEGNFKPEDYTYGAYTQFVNYGEDVEPVTAKPFAGSVFINWSDGVETATRHDKNVTSDIDVYANFIKANQTLTYVYNQATAANTEKSITLSWGKLNLAVFALPQKEGYVFQGWFLEPELINKVTNHAGQLLMGNEVLIKNKGSLYAKWTSSEKVIFPILMVFVEEACATLQSNSDYYGINDEIIDVDVDYKMSLIEKKICALIPPLFSKYLNEMLEGLVTFEVDAYFTNEPIGTESFSWGDNSGRWTYSVGAYNIPEVGKLLVNYRSVITTFGMDDYDSLLHSGAGSGQMKYASSLIETFLGGLIINNISFETLLDLADLNWGVTMSHYTHEFVHTVESCYALDEVYEYHAVGAYLSRKGLEELEIAKLYLLNEAVIDDEKVGIPYSFWTGEINVLVAYLSNRVNEHYGGEIVSLNDVVGIGLPTPNIFEAYISFGSDIIIEAIPYDGYRFVKWSDGVTTAIRHDANVISLIYVKAIFEKME